MLIVAESANHSGTRPSAAIVPPPIGPPQVVPWVRNLASMLLPLLDEPTGSDSSRTAGRHAQLIDTYGRTFGHPSSGWLNPDDLTHFEKIRNGPLSSSGGIERKVPIVPIYVSHGLRAFADEPPSSDGDLLFHSGISNPDTPFNIADPIDSGHYYPSLCRSTDCTFDDGVSFCNLQMGLSSRLHLAESIPTINWRLSDQQVSNSLTGIFSDVSESGMFVFAGNTDDRSTHFVLSTPPFTTLTFTRLDFFVYMAGLEGRLRVCIDNLNQCPFEKLGEDVRIDARKWTNGFVHVPSGNHSVHFVADKLKKNYVIGVDEIQLLNLDASRSTECT